VEVALEARITNLEAIALRLEGLLRSLVEKEPTQAFYSVKDVSRIVGKSEYQVRAWLKTGRLLGEKRESGRGLAKEWMVSNGELELHKSMGLRACKK